MPWRAPLLALLLLSTALSSGWGLSSAPLAGESEPGGWGAPPPPAWVEPLQRLRAVAAESTPRLGWRPPQRALRRPGAHLQTRHRAAHRQLCLQRPSLIALGRCQSDGG